jgi:hypothetical protein
MRNIFVISIFSCIFAVSAAAQNLDPTVEVSREYEGKLVEVHKPAFTMAVPDSVTRFALDFDYSVFENPYKGSYEFNPYLLTLKPSVSGSGESRFYLKAGAGYQLHPTFDLVWSPKLGKQRNLNLDVYALHRSFVGNYLTIAPEFSGDGTAVMTRLPKKDDGIHKWFGYDLMSKAGASARIDYEKLALDFGAGYYGLLQKDRAWQRGYNAVDADFGISTKPETVESLTFDLDVDYRYGQDRVGSSELTENVLGLELLVGPLRAKKQRLAFGFGGDFAFYSGALSATAGEIHFVPRYVFKKNRLDISAGIKVSKLLAKDQENGMYGSMEQYVYPDVHLSYVLLPNSLKVYLMADGGNRLDTYSSLIEGNHHITHQLPALKLDYTVERVALTAGFDGRITDLFSYNIRGGYANYANMMAYGLVVAQTPSFSVEYISSQKAFAAMDWVFSHRGVRFDGTVMYDHYFDLSSDQVLAPAAFHGNAAVEYSWRDRIIAGADCNFATASKGSCVIPGYADLGVYAEYATARNLSFWLRAGNLLNMTIQRNPLYAEKGVNCTVGICLNL